ncbi:MAG: isoleucine--tRNA ligase, partial [Clostridiales bacterium]|nr:isoleucine--tRNA ligase [Clostridiales bacterium]
KSVYVKFKLKNKENEYFLAWTTTPWTLPSNTSLTVNAKEIYAKVKLGDEFFILAEALVESVLGEEAETIQTFKGKELEFIEYEPIFNFFSGDSEKRAHIVVCDDYVTLTDGTGIVHCAPAFGEDDYRVGKKYSLKFVMLVDEQGKFTEQAGKYAGIFVKDADALIINDMKQSGTLLYAANYEHNYPFCWRCDTPLLYYARSAWFIEMTKLRDNLLKNNATVNWMPETIKNGRFGHFLADVVDWGISRERYWGTPLPVWECACGHKTAIGSIAELKEKGINVPDDIELHRPYIDDVFLKCEKCGSQMKRVPEVIDCWFDSGSMPFAQWHYPFENKELFDLMFPADFISEAIDQTRGWFYTLMAIGTLLFDKSPYENVIVLGHVQDKDGQKLSKAKGNYVDPSVILEKFGADAIRWFFYAGSSPWLSSRFYDDAVIELSRKFMGTLWNSYAFYVLYADIDNFDPTQYVLDKEKLDSMDLWALSKLNTLVKNVDEYLSAYKITEAARALSNFTDELSNWYLRRCRERFWAGGIEQDKINAYMTLYTILDTMSKLSAPFVPFMAETIYRNITAKFNKSVPISVHLTDFPVCNENFINTELELKMETVLNLVVLGRSARNTANIKNRQPLSKMYVNFSGDLDSEQKKIIAEELNVREVEFTEKIDEFASYKFKPQLKTLGPRYGKLLPKISKYLSEVDGNDFYARVSNETAKFEIDGNTIELSKDDVLIETIRKEGFVGDSDKGFIVVLDVNLTPDLIEEGYVREIVSKIQTMRKESDFNVTDKIRVLFKSSPVIEKVFEKYAEKIKSEVLGEEIVCCGNFEGLSSKEWDINGESAVFAVIRE